MTDSQARPLCILLPGTDGTGAFFDSLRQALDDHDVHVVSYPQYGDQSYERLGRLILPALPRDRDYVLIGESFGGPLAIWLAVHAAHKPMKMILGATFACSPFGALGRAILPLLVIGQWLPLWIWQINLILFNNKNRQMAETINETVKPVPRSVLLDRVRAVLTCDVRGWLSQIALPVLCLNAAKDRLIPPWLPRGFDRLPDATVVDLDLPHMIFQSDAEGIVVKHLRPFLQR